MSTKTRLSLSRHGTSTSQYPEDTMNDAFGTKGPMHMKSANGIIIHMRWSGSSGSHKNPAVNAVPLLASRLLTRRRTTTVLVSSSLVPDHLTHQIWTARGVVRRGVAQ